MDIAHRRRVRVLTRTINGGMPCRNRFGVLLYEANGTNSTPVAFTQLHRNGEIWGVTREFWQPYAGSEVVTMGNVENRVRDGITNFIDIAMQELEISPPYEIEVGAVGLKNMRLSLPAARLFYQNQFSEPVYDEEFYIRAVVNNVTGVIEKIIMDFMRGLYDLAGVDLPVTS